MLNWVIRSGIRLRLVILFVAAVAMYVGLSQLGRMPVDVLPEFSEPYVEVQTEALGLSATEVEQLITVPLEADLLNGVAWLKTIRSKSIPGLSSIVLVFEPGTDVLRARQMVQERLTQAIGLPNVSKPSAMLQPISSANRVMQIGLTAREISQIDMSVLTRWTIRPRLMGVPGVANVAVWGQRNRQLQVQVDTARLKEHGVTLNQVIRTAGDALWVSPLTFLEASTPGTGGWIDTPNQRLGVRHLMPITSSEQLAKVAVADSTLVLEDVATVTEDHQPLIGDAVVNGGIGLMLVIEKFPWANTLEVTRGVEAAIDAMRPGLTGIEIDTTLFRPAGYIEKSIGNLGTALPVGAALVIVVLFAFIHGWRLALVGIAAMLISLLVTALVIYLRGATFNMMILAGLAAALGVVIDEAIIDTDSIARQLRQGRQHGKTVAAMVGNALMETRRVAIFATLITLLAVVPLLFLENVSGAFLVPLALSYGLAVVASMAVALTVTPALSVMLLPGTGQEARTSPLAARLRSAVERLAQRLARSTLGASAIVAVLLLAGAVAWPQLAQQSLVPAFKELDLLVEWEGAPGTSRQAMNRIVQKATGELRQVPGVRSVSAHVGRAVLSDEIVDVNSSDLWVNIDPDADYEATVAAVRAVVDGYPGMRHDVLTFLRERTREATSGEDEAIVVRVYGQDLATLREKSIEVRDALSGIAGIVDATVEQQFEEPSLEIKPDLAKVRRYGLKPGDVRRAAATVLSGLEVGLIFEQQKVFDVVVWGTPETRHSLTSVNELLIDTPDGGHVSLKEVADIRIVPVPIVIEREGVARQIDITANVSGRDLGSVTADVDRAIKQISFPLEHHAEVLGEYAERQAAQQRALSFAVAAAAAIFLLLQSALGSWRLAVVVLICLPAAMAGGVISALAGGAAISLGSLAGLLAIYAVAARFGLALMRRFQTLEHEEGQSFGEDLVTRATGERCVPVLATAIAMAVAFLPAAVVGDVAGFEILHPMAIVVLGGLVTSVVVTLFVLPALYLRFGAGARPEPSLAAITMETS